MNRTGISALTVLVVCAFNFASFAQETSTNPSSDRYFYGLLDQRSSFGTDFFPSPIAGPYFDRNNLLDLSYAHSEDPKFRYTDELRAGVNYSIDNLTLGASFGWRKENFQLFFLQDHEGLGEISFSARHPFYQYVSDDRSVDVTFGARADLGIPSTSDASHDGSVGETVYSLARFGDHASLQGSVSFSQVYGPINGGELDFRYSLTAGYELNHQAVPMPYTTRMIPMIEIEGTVRTSKPFDGTSALLAFFGTQVDLPKMHGLEPELILGYGVPIYSDFAFTQDWILVADLTLRF